MISIENAVLTQSGVCANYAHLYSLLLNIVGVTAMPIVTGEGFVDPRYHNESHEVAYIKLQMPGTSQPMWYLSDATWAKASRLIYQKTPIAYSPQNDISYHEFLLPIGKSYNEPLNQAQFSNGEFFSLPWPDLFNKKNDNVKYAVGPYEYQINEDKHEVLSPVFKNGYMYNYILQRAAGDIIDNRSAYEFYNGKFYALRSVKRKDGLYKMLISQDLNSNIPSEVDFYNVIDDATAVAEIQASMNNATIERTDNLFGSYKDKFIFVANNFKSKYSTTQKAFYLVVNNDNKKFIKITIPNINNYYITNFYANEEGIFYSLNFSTQYHKLEMTDEQKAFYQTSFNPEQIKQDFINFAKLQQVDINSYVIGALPGQISISDKIEFNNLIEYCIQNIDKVDLTIAKNLIIKLANQYKEKANNINNLMWNSKQNTVINKPKDSFEQYGITMSPIVYQNLEQIAHAKNSLVYVSIMGSMTKEGRYNELAKNIPIANLKITKDIIKDGVQFLKFRYYYNLNDSNYFETEPIFLNFAAQQYDDSLAIYFNNTYQTSNYSNKLGWEKSPVTLQLINYKKDSNYELYFISKNKEIKKLSTDQNQLVLGTINQDNAGLYFFVKKQIINDKEYKQYSNFFYALSSSDIYDPAANALFIELLKIAKNL
ncbi:hypothetical protein [Mycoplasma sp. 31_09]|uniref:hypothetical protein n=1 Tax=Mycoplasma sp. 31_09 TaxID=3401663 RepID=UPI003AAFFA4E